MKSNSDSSLLSAIRPTRGEKILEIDGTVTTQPVLEHVGISTWPGKCLKVYILYAIFLIYILSERKKKLKYTFLDTAM
jgi:hypothetical protein